jgi:hypothetical protein
MHYMVTLAVELDDVDTPDEAARAGYGIMRDPAISPPVLVVRDEAGRETCIDLDPRTRCPDRACREQGCPEHPLHDSGDHTYEQHHGPGDHIGPGGRVRPDLCRCTVYVSGGPVISGEIPTGALIHDLAIMLNRVLFGYSPDVAADRIRDVLGITPGELTAGIEDRLARALRQPAAGNRD